MVTGRSGRIGRDAASGRDARRGRRGGRRRPLAALAGALAMAFATALPAAQPAAALPAVPAPAAVSASEQTPSQRFGGCLAGGGEADLLLLIDDSGSLRETDPSAARVTSANHFLASLATTAERSGTPLEVSVRTFGHAIGEAVPWTALGGASLGAIQAGVAQLANRTDGQDTDYWLAFEAARAELAERQEATPDAPRCQGIVLLSDGRLSIEPRGSDAEFAALGGAKPYAPAETLRSAESAAAAMAAAQEDLCRAGGLADQLSASEIALFGIGLAPPGTPEAEFDLLQAIITGTGAGGTNCRAEAGGARGEFMTASDVDSLIFAFDAISNPGKPPLQQTAGLCPAGFCVEQSHRFVLDTTTPEVRILAMSSAPGVAASLRMPDQTTIDIPSLPPGQPFDFEKYGMTGRASWISDRTVGIEFHRGTTPLHLWQGLWQLAVSGAGGQGQSSSNIHLSGSLAPSWAQAGQATLRSGEVLAGQVFEVGFVDGEDLDPTLMLGSMEYSGTIVDARGGEHPIFATTDPSRVGRAERIDLSEAAVGEGKVVLRLELRTAHAIGADGQRVEGTRLEPSIVAFPVTILPPASYPALGAAAAFAAGDAAGGIEGSLELAGEGCAWIEPGATATIEAAPAGLGAIAVRAPGAEGRAACRAAASGEPLRLEVRSERPGTGTIQGTIPVSIAAADGSGDPIVVDVPFAAEATAPVGGWKLALGIAAALLAGLGIPLALLWLGGAANARIPARSFAVARIPVRVADGEVRRDGALLELREGDLAQRAPNAPGGLRYLRLGEATLRPRASRVPGLVGRVRVEALPGVGAAPASLATVQGGWILLRRAGAAAGAAEVIAFPRLGADEEELRAIARSVRAEGAARFAEASAQAEGGPAAPAEPGPGDGSGAVPEPSASRPGSADGGGRGAGPAAEAPASAAPAGFSPWRTATPSAPQASPNSPAPGAIPGWSAPRR